MTRCASTVGTRASITAPVRPIRKPTRRVASSLTSGWTASDRRVVVGTDEIGDTFQSALGTRPPRARFDRLGDRDSAGKPSQDPREFPLRARPCALGCARTGLGGRQVATTRASARDQPGDAFGTTCDSTRAIYDGRNRPKRWGLDDSRRTGIFCADCTQECGESGTVALPTRRSSERQTTRRAVAAFARDPGTSGAVRAGSVRRDDPEVTDQDQVLLADGRAALRSGDAFAARRAFEAVGAHPSSGDVLEGLARCSYIELEFQRDRRVGSSRTRPFVNATTGWVRSASRARSRSCMERSTAMARLWAAGWHEHSHCWATKPSRQKRAG